MKSRPHFLMCKPDYYVIAYEINPWMNMNNQVDPEKSHVQWEKLYEILPGLKADVSLIEPVNGLPDMVFTANAGLVQEDKVILGRFKYKEREPESSYYVKWFSDHGLYCHNLPDGIFFEGEGDSVFYKDMLLLGHGFRTNMLSHPHVGNITGMGYISLELVDPRFYHLDTCLLFIDSLDLIIYYPGAFHPDSAAEIERLPSNILNISEEDACSFVCNSVCLDNNILLYKCSDTLSHILKEYGLNPVYLDTSEFMKSGGSVRCMVLRLA